MFRCRFDFHSEGMTRDMAALQGRGRGKAGMPDDIARGENVWYLGPKLRIDL
jgi:hypothetical protein